MSETEEKRGWLSRFGWGKILLTVSLALNLLFIGSMVGARWMHHKHGSRWEGPPDFVVKRMLHDLPEAKQKTIFDLVAGHREAQRSRIEELRTQKRAFKTALRSEQFNAVDIRKAAEKLRASRVALGEAKTDLLIKAMESLTTIAELPLTMTTMFMLLARNLGEYKSLPPMEHLS